MAEAGIEPSVGQQGDSYGNALAETINGLYTAKLIHRRAPWRTKKLSNWQPWNGYRGSTSTGCSSPSATYPRLRQTQTTIGNLPAWKTSPADFDQTAFTFPGTVHSRMVLAN